MVAQSVSFLQVEALHIRTFFVQLKMHFFQVSMIGSLVRLFFKQYSSLNQSENLPSFKLGFEELGGIFQVVFYSMKHG